MHDRELFIDGRWRAAREGRRATIADPATGEPVGSTAIADVFDPAPYTTPGTLPAARTRRAAFLLPGSRSCASRTFTSAAVAIIPFRPSIETVC